AIGVELPEPSLGPRGRHLKVEPATIGQSPSLQFRWARGIATICIGKHGVPQYLRRSDRSFPASPSWPRAIPRAVPRLCPGCKWSHGVSSGRKFVALPWVLPGEMAPCGPNWKYEWCPEPGSNRYAPMKGGGF